MSAHGKAPRGLSVEEAAVWNRVAQTVTPLAGKARLIAAPHGAGDLPPAKPVRPNPVKPVKAPRAPLFTPPRKLPVARVGHHPGLDSHWERRLKIRLARPGFYAGFARAWPRQRVSPAGSRDCAGSRDGRTRGAADCGQTPSGRSGRSRRKTRRNPGQGARLAGRWTARLCNCSGSQGASQTWRRGRAVPSAETRTLTVSGSPLSAH